jgi:hypothetical protein
VGLVPGPTRSIRGLTPLPPLQRADFLMGAGAAHPSALDQEADLLSKMHGVVARNDGWNAERSRDQGVYDGTRLPPSLLLCDSQ